LALLLLAAGSGSSLAADSGPFLATGFKIGEVTPATAIVWTRLTRRAERNPSDGPEVEIEYAKSDVNTLRRGRRVKALHFPEGGTVADLREAVPGVDGDVRIRFGVEGSDDRVTTPWQPVNGLRDFTAQFTLDDLQPATTYSLSVESRDIHGKPGATTTGSFRTAPLAEEPARVVFTVSTGQGNDDQDSPDGFKIYPAMLKIDPDFFVHTGDIVYYDALAKTVDLARYHWQRTYSWPTNVAFHQHVGSYFMKDDHDTWLNDCWPTMPSDYMHEFTFRQGQAIFLEQVPMGDSTFRTARWGKDLQIWLVEGRDFRSPNDAPDGPDKTIWGPAQRKWFEETFAASDATFRVLISPTPLVGPDRATKNDNHANSGFQHEGRELRAFLAGQKNATVVCGDRHWQYMSVDPRTGLREYSCGPASDLHAGGWKQEDYREDYHRYLNVIGGFLSATIERKEGKPTLTYRFHDADGKVKYEDVLTAQ